jgi:hypothetical protein
MFVINGPVAQRGALDLAFTDAIVPERSVIIWNREW